MKCLTMLLIGGLIADIYTEQWGDESLITLPFIHVKNYESYQEMKQEYTSYYIGTKVNVKDYNRTTVFEGLSNYYKENTLKMDRRPVATCVNVQTDKSKMIAVLIHMDPAIARTAKAPNMTTPDTHILEILPWVVFTRRTYISNTEIDSPCLKQFLLDVVKDGHEYEGYCIADYGDPKDTQPKWVEMWAYQQTEFNIIS